MCDKEDRNARIFSLQEIANWQEASTNINEESVRIPAIQRGLVWNATQAEILWDSLMRGIPIGTFTLVKDSNGYELLDGQQRANTIAMGFRAMPSDDADDLVKRKPLLWIDLNPVLPEGSRCKFVFRVTTPGQPWGYKLPTVITENNSNRLDTEQRRGVLKENGIVADGTSILTKKPYPCQIKKPYGARNPVLFSTLFSDDNLTDVPDDIKRGIEIVKRTKIFALCSTDALHNDDVDWLPTFFTRMNKQGVEPDQEEIIYSNVKHLVPQLKKADEYAHGRGIRASRMANLMLKVYFSELEKRWVSSVDLKKIRQLDDKNDINCFVAGFCERLERINAWCKDVPEPSAHPVTISMFAMRNPDVYQWLLLNARSPAAGKDALNGRRVLSCATVLAWFCGEDKKEELRKHLFQLDPEGSLLPLIHKGLLALPPNPEEIPQNDTFPFTEEVAPHFDRYVLTCTKQRMSKIWSGFDNKEGCELLLYACRKYMNDVFWGYGRIDSYWQEDNRPWDYDHIVPKVWLACGRGNRHGQFHELVAHYLCSLGNSAPIPFSINRSKNDQEPTENYCKEKQSDLYLNKADLGAFKKGIEDNKEKAKDFVKATSTRFYRLYESWFTSLDIGVLFDVKKLKPSDHHDDINRMVDSRRKIFMSLLESYPELLKVYAVIGNYEYPLDNNREEWWFLPWLSIGIALPNGKSFVAISTTGKWWHFGLRKHPNLQQVDAEYAKKLDTPNGYVSYNRDWWYYYKEKECKPLGYIPDEIFASFKELINQAAANNEFADSAHVLR